MIPYRRVSDRSCFRHVEHSRVFVGDGAVMAETRHGTGILPVRALAAVLLGEGTTITQRAVAVTARAGCGLYWVSSSGLLCCAFGPPTVRQGVGFGPRHIEMWVGRRLEVARALWAKKFGRPAPEGTIEVLLGAEGAATKKAYASAAQSNGLAWEGRTTGGADFANRCISAVSGAVNSLSHAAILQLGMIPALGFLHSGEALAFVYDIADLYRLELTIPLAMQLASEESDLPLSRIYRAISHRLDTEDFMKRVVKDLTWLVESQ